MAISIQWDTRGVARELAKQAEGVAKRLSGRPLEAAMASQSLRAAKAVPPLSSSGGSSSFSGQREAGEEQVAHEVRAAYPSWSAMFDAMERAVGRSKARGMWRLYRAGEFEAALKLLQRAGVVPSIRRDATLSGYRSARGRALGISGLGPRAQVIAAAQSQIGRLKGSLALGAVRFGRSRSIPSWVRRHATSRNAPIITRRLPGGGRSIELVSLVSGADVHQRVVRAALSGREAELRRLVRAEERRIRL